MKKRINYVLAAMLLAGSAHLMASELSGSIKVGLFESETEAMKQIEVPMDVAIKTAKNTIPGQVVKAKVDEEDGYLVYEIKIIQPDGEEKKVLIDPVTGNVLEAKSD